MRIAFFWESNGLSLTKANPYAALLARALTDCGVEVVAGYAHEFTEDWLRANQGHIQVLHMNWLHIMYPAPDLSSRLAAAEAFIGNLALARELGYKVVWTVHNLYPHDSANLALDRLVRLAVTQLATGIIVHCAHAGDQVARHFHRRDDVVVIPHGNFIAAYPNEISRAEARQRLGFDDDHFVYLFFGNVRLYKGLEQLLEVFKSLPGEHLRLLLGARVYNDYGERFAEQAAQADPRIVLRTSRFFANEEFQLLFNAADVGVFPFVNVLTSGSVITALSFDLPVIIPAVGCLPELLTADAGLIYDPAEPEALRQAMQSIQARDNTAMRAAARQIAHSLDWASIAEQTIAVYGRG